ncbi:MAG TPA: hypothetical protein VLL48_02535, partial [Longimicrobiales bacterium]|nr:hypothetical protein [Longimicrobiales bacterium]
MTAPTLAPGPGRPGTLILQAAEAAATQQGVPADALESVLGGESAQVLIRAVLTVAIGLPVLLVATRLIRRWVTEKYSAQQGMVTGKLLLYSGLA